MSSTAKWRVLQGVMQLVTDPRARREGIPVSEAAELLGVAKKDVARRIHWIGDAMARDAEPGSYYDADVAQGRVRIYAGPELPGPTRLSLREAVALFVALGRVADAPGFADDVERLREKLLSAVAAGTEAAAIAASSRVKVRSKAGAAGEILGLLREAVDARLEVEITHYSRRKDRLWTGRIQPHLLVQHRGDWYVIGRADFRYRLDMIREAKLCAECFEPDPDFDPERFRTDVMFDGKSEHEVVLRTAGGRQAVRTASPAGVRAWVRSLLGAVAVDGPPEAREAMVEELREILGRYEQD